MSHRWSDEHDAKTATDLKSWRESWREFRRRSKGFPLNRLLALARPQWRSLSMGTVFLLVGSAMGLAWPQAIRYIMDGASSKRDSTLIDHAAAAMVLILLVQGIAIALRSYLFSVAGERIVIDLRRRLYSQLLQQEVAFFDGRRTGDLISRLSSDTVVLQNAVSVQVSMTLRNLLMILGGIGLLFYISPPLASLMMLVVPPIALGAVLYGRRIRSYSRGVQDALAQASEVAQESLSAVRTVRAFTAERREEGRYGEAVERSFLLARRRSAVTSIFMGASSFAGYMAVAFVLWLGGRRVLAGEMTLGELTSFVLYTLTVAFSIGGLGGLWVDFMRATGAADRVFELLERSPEMDNEAGASPSSTEGALYFEAVSFHYPARPTVPVLTKIDLQLEPGTVVALVGPSGGGKSTIGALLLRFYDPDEGRVLLDGRDLRELSPVWLRRRVGVVAQEPILFSASVAENIRYGRPEASDEELMRAAVLANADSFVRAFPNGYETEVGERGLQLSGGQRQRIAIARAILKDPQILLLDEATSALDAQSEHLVKEALERLMQGRTTLIIAHRLSTVRDAHEVVVLERGQVVERGTHAELLSKKGLYHSLIERQLSEPAKLLTGSDS